MTENTNVEKTEGQASAPRTGSVHYCMQGLEARSDYWRGLSTWKETTDDAIKQKGFYEEENEASNLGWRGFRIVKRTIEVVEPNVTNERRVEK